MPDTNHVILTRFNLPTPGVESLIRAREGWLRERVELFLRYCVPSVESQVDADVQWLVFFDPESPQWLLDRLASVVERGVFTPIYRTTVSTQDLVDDLREVVLDKGARLLTTNLDNDDALAQNACSRLQLAPSKGDREVIYLSQGLIKSPDGLYLRTDRRNAFVSVRESWDDPVTSWSEYHNEFPRIMPAVNVGGDPGWLQVVHGSNVSNRVRGRRVAPQRYATLFGEGLAEVTAPSRSEVGADLLVGLPVRSLRDAGRSSVRRVGLALMGKEGYAEAKRKFASFRPFR